MVVARLTMPFISIRVKKLTWKGKACITNQYLPVSSSQITTEERKTISASRGELKDSNPDRKRNATPSTFSCRWIGSGGASSCYASRGVVGAPALFEGFFTYSV